jgi:hypothetical protein
VAKKTTKAERSKPEASRNHQYAEAYAAGQQDASGVPFAVPTNKSIFWPVLQAHAVDAHGQPLRGEAVIAWLRASSAEYRRARASKAEFERGFAPEKWRDWLQSGKAATQQFVRGRQVEFQSAPADPEWRRQADEKLARDQERLRLEREQQYAGSGL